MNYSYKQTVRKQKELLSTQNRETTRLLFSIFKFLIYVIILCSITGGCFFLGVVRGLIQSAPDINDVSIMPSQYSTTVYDANGKKINKLVTSGSNRIKVSIDQVPEHLQWAFIDIEDERFYEHNGIDIKGIGRAAWSVIKDHDMQGASTITQQLLKNNVFTGWTEESSLGSTVKRKIQEQYLAVKYEKITNKKTILETYLNTINLGANTLGVQAASHRYFNKDVSKLTVSESAVIASITQNPSKYNPITNPEENSKRRMSCLKYMLKNGHITEEQYKEAVDDNVYERIQKVDAKITNNKDNEVYSYFVDEVINQVLTDLQEQKGYTYTQAYNALYSGGLKVYSTLDPDIQKICDEELSNDENYPSSIYWSINWAYTVQHEDGTAENYSESYISYYHKTLLQESAFKLIFSSQEEAKNCVEDYKHYLYPDGLAEGDTEYETLYFTPQPQVSFTVMDQKTGYVKAIVGGRGDKKVSLSLDRATQSTRQPGSTFKILSTYAPAIDTRGYNLNTTIVDEPYYYTTGRPVQNWNNTYLGAVTVKKAIAQSMNVCAVKTLTDIGVQLGYDYLLNFGITTLVDQRVEEDGSVMSDIQQALALGGITDGVTNLEMTGAYAAIANDGVYTRPVFYSQVVDENGRIILDNTEPTTHTVLKETTAALLTEAMKSVITEGTGGACKLNSSMAVAGKTGTTSNAYDLWFCGYTPYLTASIWTGFDENKELAFSQIYHETLWAKIMNRINETKGYVDKDFDYTENLEKVKICTSSKKLATSYCPHVSEDYYSKGSSPTESCNLHTAATVDSDSDDEKSEEETTTKKKKQNNN